MTGNDLNDEDKRAWQAATRHVRPLSGRRAKAPSTRSVRLSVDAPLTAPPARAASFAPPENRQNERTIKRGKQPISASFDLHGHTQDSAWRLLPQFLIREQARGSRCVIVITGKGKSGEGLLRRNFLQWLEMPGARALVSGFAPAHPRHGGTGAWYVFLRHK